MKKVKKATSIVESMIIMLIVVSGITGMYSIYIQSAKLSQSVENKIKAIQISSQAIEGFTNIRDTNWLRFSSDYNMCWNTLNYNPDCIGTSNYDHTIQPGSYLIYRGIDNKWYLDNITVSDNFGTGTYIDDFEVGLDSNGIYNQTGSLNDLKPIFTRELQIKYLKSDGSIGDTSDSKIHILSIVQWVDSSSTKPHKIEIEQVLSNWKK